MDLWSRLGFSRLFDDIFYAARLGALKPQPEFFAAIDKAIGPQGEVPLLFDDSESVIEGARVHGWEAVLYDEIADCAGHPAIAAILDRQN
jgi:putative hydrolase of the HAD superfamily